MNGAHKAVIALALGAALSGCAPDAWRNAKATGFNDYLDVVQTKCQPLWFGSMYLQTFDISSAGPYQSNFASLLDTTSRLYYNRITPADFRTAVQSQNLGSYDERTNRTIDCMIAQLPPDRPHSPPGAILQ
jgi:hypothetical protein